MMGWYGGTGWGMGWAGWLGMGAVMVVFWGLLAFGVVTLVRSGRLGRRAVEPATGHDPRWLLDESLARGTISVEEYQRRREILEGR